MIRFIKYRWINFIFSGVLGILSIIIIIIYGFNFGIEFKGGAAVEVISSQPFQEDTIREEAKKLNVQINSVQPQSRGAISIRSDNLDENTKNQLLSALKQKTGDITEISFQTIGPSFGRDATRRAIIAIGVAVIAIVAYISFAFRGVKHPFASWQMALSAIFALVHDTLLTLGFVAATGILFGWQLDSLIIVALLTLLGFSVHDTIVVFDRIRENLKILPESSIEKTIDFSINQTLARSIATSLTLFLVVISLTVLGSGTIRHFTATLAVGIFFGTYSSIFIASPLLIYWRKR